MAQIDLIAAQLTAALDRLEEAVQPLREARLRDAEQLAEIAALKEERVQLLARIAELEDDARNLGAITNDVEGRLDSAISDIRAALAR